MIENMTPLHHIAVTGASGHLGNVICRTLLTKGFSISALCHSDTKALEGLTLKRVQGNVLNQNDLETLLHDCDAVIHCAAMISLDGDPTGIVYKTNTEGATNVAEVAKQLGLKKMIHVSSVHAVVEKPLCEKFDETRQYKPEGSPIYDYSKALGEQLVFDTLKNSNTQLIVIRPSSILGPFDFKPSEIGKAMLMLYHKQLPIITAGGYDFVDVRDVANAIVEAIGKDKNNEIYHLTGHYATLKDFVQLINHATNKKAPTLVLPFWLLKAMIPALHIQSKLRGTTPIFTQEMLDTIRNGHSNMISDKAQKELDFQCRPLEESIADFYKWQKTTMKAYNSFK
jgi:dihydroflavonol-4-reductase